jgi:hypothetical protein
MTWLYPLQKDENNLFPVVKPGWEGDVAAGSALRGKQLVRHNALELERELGHLKVCGGRWLTLPYWGAAARLGREGAGCVVSRLARAAGPTFDLRGGSKRQALRGKERLLE